MIAKTLVRVKSRKPLPATSRFSASIKYAADLDEGWTQGLSAELIERHELAASSSIIYAMSEKEGVPTSVGERVIGVFGHGVTSLSTAAREMEAVARQKDIADPVTHFVISYDTTRGEAPTAEQMQEDVERLLRARGYTDSRKHLPGKSVAESATARAQRDAKKQEGVLNQYVGIIHGDTKNRHVHGIGNRVAWNGIVTDDYRSKVKNEGVCAAIATERGWEIVAGKHNSEALLRQAKDRGASAEELLALERREAATLDRLREASAPGPVFDRAAEQAVRQTRNAEFSVIFGDRIQESFATTTSYSQFVGRCKDEGVNVKLRVEAGKEGRKFYKVSFAALDDSSGQGGSKIGVSAKDLRTKFPEMDAIPPSAAPIKSTPVETRLASQETKAPTFLTPDQFAEKHGPAIRLAFERSDSQPAFDAALYDIGIDAKLRVETGKDGKTFNKLAFSTRDGATEIGGASGTAVGLPAKSVLTRFGHVAPTPEPLPAKPAPVQPEAPGVGELQRYSAALQTRAAEARREIARRDRSKLGAVINFIGAVGEAFGSRSARDMRRIRRQRHERQNSEAQKLDRRGAALGKALERIEADKKRVADQLPNAPEWRQERLFDQLAALSSRAKYEVARDAFIVSEGERLGRETEKAWEDAKARRDGRVFIANVGLAISSALVSGKGRQKYAELRELRARASVKRQMARQDAKQAFGDAKAKVTASKQAAPTFGDWLKSQETTSEIAAARRHGERLQKWIDEQREKGKSSTAQTTQKDHPVTQKRFFDQPTRGHLDVSLSETPTKPETPSPEAKPSLDVARDYLLTHQAPAKNSPEYTAWLRAAGVVRDAEKAENPHDTTLAPKGRGGGGIGG